MSGNSIGLHDNDNISISTSKEPYEKLQTSSINGCTVQYCNAEIKFEDIVSEGDSRISGDHHEDGILIMKGPDIKKAYQLNSANILDITPTLLYLNGLEVGRDMDGKIITEIINDDYLKNNSVKYIDTYEPAQPVKTPVPELIEDDDIKNRFKELGYMD